MVRQVANRFNSNSNNNKRLVPPAGADASLQNVGKPLKPPGFPLASLPSPLPLLASLQEAMDCHHPRPAGPQVWEQMAGTACMLHVRKIGRGAEKDRLGLYLPSVARKTNKEVLLQHYDALDLL